MLPATKLSPELESALENVRQWHRTATKAEKQAMWAAQRESWIRAMAPCEHGVADFEECEECRAMLSAIRPKDEGE